MWAGTGTLTTWPGTLGLRSGVSRKPPANTREKDGNLNWPGFSPEMRGLTCIVLLRGGTRGPGQRVLKNKELLACPVVVVALRGTKPSHHPGPSSTVGANRPRLGGHML